MKIVFSIFSTMCKVLEKIIPLLPLYASDISPNTFVVFGGGREWQGYLLAFSTKYTIET